MLSDFLRDRAFTIAWFGLMTMVWLGWTQESPDRVKSWVLGVGSRVGILFTAGFGVLGFTPLTYSAIVFAVRHA